jgi:hypothetical protein
MHGQEAQPDTELATDGPAPADSAVDRFVREDSATTAQPPEFDVEPYFGKRITPEPSVMAPIFDRANRQLAAEAGAKRDSVLRLLERVHGREARKA